MKVRNKNKNKALNRFPLLRGDRSILHNTGAIPINFGFKSVPVGKTFLMGLVAISLSGLFFSGRAMAQTEPGPLVLRSEGIAGDIDKHRRSPILSLSTETSQTGARILVDTSVPDPVYAKYPVRVDFFVNRKLFSSQIRSPELPGPLGIEVPTALAALPFNYSVVATLIHPNRTFTTVINGAVFANTLGKVYDCTLTLPDDKDSAVEYIAEEIPSSQTGPKTIYFAFLGTSDEPNKQATARISLQLGAGATLTETGVASASIEQDGKTLNLALSGALTRQGDAIQSMELTSASGEEKLSCLASQ